MQFAGGNKSGRQRFPTNNAFDTFGFPVFVFIAVIVPDINKGDRASEQKNTAIMAFLGRWLVSKHQFDQFLLYTIYIYVQLYIHTKGLKVVYLDKPARLSICQAQQK